MARNPKAFTNKSRGKAKVQRMRTADKEQRRMHGATAACTAALSERTCGSRKGPCSCMLSLSALCQLGLYPKMAETQHLQPVA